MGLSSSKKNKEKTQFKRIKEGVPDNRGDPIRKEESDELYSYETAICKIKGISVSGTGFFCEINDDDIPFKKALFTSNHVLNEESIGINKKIKFEYCKQEKSIIITEKRKVFTNKDDDLDYTCIEIVDTDDIKKYFRIDENIFNDKKSLIDKEIFILQYPFGKLSFDSGIISDIQDNILFHNVPTKGGSSGSPLIRRYNINFIIGMHNGEIPGNKTIYNYAAPFDEIIKDIKFQISSQNINEFRNTINLIYEKLENDDSNNDIFGQEFVENNKENIILKINGKENKLIEKYDLKEGINNIQIIIKKKLISLAKMFYDVNLLKNIEELKYLDTKEVNNFSYMFSGCSSLSDIKAIQNWNVSSGNNFEGMFYGCSSLSDIKTIQNWNVSNGNNFSYMFYGCSSLSNINALQNWIVSNGNNFSYMFYGCSSLSKINALQKWNVSNGNNFEYMFYGCSSLSDIKAIQNWNVSNKNYFENMFYECSSLKQNSDNSDNIQQNDNAQRKGEENNIGVSNPNSSDSVDNHDNHDNHENTVEEKQNSKIPEQWRNTCEIKIDEDSFPDKQAPRLDLKPIYIFGYREKDAINNIKYIDNNSFLYPAGKIAVIQNISDKAQQYFIKHKREICSLCVNYDRTIIATGEENIESQLSSNNNSVVRIWESKTLKEIAEMKIPYNGVSAMSFNLDGKYLVCCCLDKNHKVVVINVKEKKRICEEDGNRENIFSLAFKNENEFATVGLNHYKFWNISENNKGFKLISKENKNTKNDDKLITISVMNDFFVTGSSLGYITLWKNEANKKSKKCHDSQINCLYSDNKIIISGGNDKVLKVLDKNLSILNTISLESESIINFSPRSIDILPGEPVEKDIKNILIGTSSGDILELIFNKSILKKEKPEIKIYNSSHFSSNAKEINEITSISFSKKLNLFVTTSEDKTIRFWNTFIKIQDKFIYINEEMKPTASNFSNKGSILVIGFDTGKLRFYSTDNIKTMIKEFQMDNRKSPITVIKYNEQDTLLACATTDEKGNNVIDIYFWDSLNLYASIIGAKNQINGLDWSKDGHFLVAYSHQKECNVFNILDKSMITEYEEVDYKEWYSWTLGYGWPLKGYYEAIDIPIYSCERFYVIYGKNIIVIGDINGAVKLFKYPIIDKEQQCIKPDLEHGKKITNVKYGKVGVKHIILTSSSDGCLIAWKIESI